jgi:hypothetical protein
MNNTIGVALLGTSLALFSAPAYAVEGALGRTLPGVWVMPQGAVIGPQAGFTATLMPVGYLGSISGKTEIPVARKLVTDISVSLSMNYLIPQYVYKSGNPKFNFASSLMAPVAWVGVDAFAQVGSPAASVRRKCQCGLV